MLSQCSGDIRVITAPFYQVLALATPPAPTHHATVIVPAPFQPLQPPQPHHVTVVTMGPTSVINAVSTSRHNLDTIVQVRRETEADLWTIVGKVFRFEHQRVLSSLTSLNPLSPGNPAHRGHPGKGLCWRGRAAEGGHRHFRACPLRRCGLRHSLKQRRARRLFTALSSSSKSHTPYTYIRAHTYTQKAQADQGYRRLQTHSTLV